jgi:broad specificity phosphatase PhoE
VTHADVIKALVAHVLGFSLDQHDRLEVSPASVSVLVAGDWGAKVLSLNEGAR